MATVLIVDDTTFTRGSLRFIVDNAGHNVIGSAKDGKEALELYRELKPDVVTMDVLMDGIDGIKALKAIRKEDPEARIIMVAALGQEEKQEEARRLGALGHIRKPFKREEVVDEIQKALTNRRSECAEQSIDHALPLIV